MLLEARESIMMSIMMDIGGKKGMKVSLREIIYKNQVGSFGIK